MFDTGSASKQWLTALVLWLFATTAGAGMAHVRYQLSETPGGFWNQSPEAIQLRASLQELAEFGLADAQMLLADQLSMSGGFRHLREAATWYQIAYDNGNHLAPGSLARMANKNLLIYRELHPYFRKIAADLEPESDYNSTWSLLEIYTSYPELADLPRMERLLVLYKRACINTCFRELFEAKVAELNGRESEALTHYESAATLSGRGVSDYFEFLERYDDRKDRFQLFANRLFEDAESLPTDVIQAIAGQLQNLSSEFEPSVLAWLDLALQKGAANAAVNRIEYMLELPDNFSFEDTAAQIDAIKQDQPVQWGLLRARLLTTRSWKKLDPFTAHELLKGLQDQRVAEASIGMGDLYSMGGLDEVDQFRAIEEYKKAAKLGYGSAFYKVANVYRHGRSICQDRVKAGAYGRMALMLGEETAEEFLSSLEQDLTVAEITQTEALYEDLLAAYPVENFE